MPRKVMGSHAPLGIIHARGPGVGKEAARLVSAPLAFGGHAGDTERDSGISGIHEYVVSPFRRLAVSPERS